MEYSASKFDIYEEIQLESQTVNKLLTNLTYLVARSQVGNLSSLVLKKHQELINKYDKFITDILQDLEEVKHEMQLSKTKEKILESELHTKKRSLSEYELNMNKVSKKLRPISKVIYRFQKQLDRFDTYVQGVKFKSKEI